MKKIVRETGNIQITGNAGIDSICFKAHRVNGSFSLLQNSVVAHINEKGEIFCEGEKEFKEEQEKVYRAIAETEQKYKKFFKKSAIITFIMSIVICFINMNFASSISAIFLVMWDCYFHTSILVLFIERIIGNKEVLRIARFHSAEHASINAYSDLKRIPTLEEIRNYSNYSYNCGSLSGIKNFTLMLLIALARLVPNPMAYIIVISVIMIAFLFIPQEKFFFMQFLVTSKPTDREYKVAIEGLEYAVEGLNSKQAETEISYIDKIMLFMDVMAGRHKFSEDVCKYCTNYKICKKQFGEK